MMAIGNKVTRAFCDWKGAFLTVAGMVALAIGTSAVIAQSGAGSIQGTVSDSTGAVIPGAVIHAVNQATNVAVNTKTNSVGFYQIPGLFTGTYIETVSAPGMKTYERTIELLVAQNAVINPTMTPGAVSQKITVSANLVQLTNRENGAVGTTLENARINQLPMNGRDIETLVNEATPGLDACSQAPSCANGLLPGATIFEIDGVTLQSDEFGGTNAGVNALPDPDAIQEVRMETSGEGAQYGTPGTGVMTTKSGTNQLHGSFFETARNNAWGIAKSRQDPANYAAPKYIRNEFGASVGGPIVVPHLYHGKDKSFFFFAYERYSLAQLNYEQGDVPTAAMRNGDWSGLVNSSGVLQSLYDPNTTQAAASSWARQTFTSEFSEGSGGGPSNCNGDTNCIPISRISPFAQVVYAISPPPTNTADPLVTNNINIPSPGYTVAPNITFRLDHVFNESNRAYLRYTSNTEGSNTGLRNNQGNEPITIGATVNNTKWPAALSGEANSPSALYAAAAGYTHIFSPTFFAETILSQQWMNESNKAGGPSPGLDVAQELGLPSNFGLKGFPDITASIRDIEGTEYQYWITGIISTIDENLTKISGKHQMQFGGRYRHERVGYQTNQDLDHVDFGAYATALENPSSNANGTYTATTNTGYSDADQFLGAAEDYTLWLEPPYVHFHDMEFDGYFQDNYHVARNFTLNLGLRYEAHPALWMKNGTIVGFDLKNDAEVLGAPVSTLIAQGYTSQAIITNIKDDGGRIETAQDAGLPSALARNYDFNFLPRFGFAWQALHKWGTVVRGAYGRYIYPVPSYFTVDQISSVAPFSANFAESYTNAAQSPDGLPNYLLRAPQTTTGPLSAGTPVAGVNSANVVNTNSTTALLPGSTAMDPSFLDPADAPDYVTEANFTIEQPLKGASALRVSWNFAHDANVWNDYYINEHPSAYVWEMNTGKAVPNGSVINSNQYAATATGPYDQTTWAGTMREVQKNGWTTDNMLQADYQRLYHRGIAYQISYIWSKPMHTGGESGSNGYVYPSANYIYSPVSTMTSPYGTVINPTLPPPQPAGTAPYAYYRPLNKFENYEVDTSFPKQEIKFNGIVDLPVGRGKRFFTNSNRFVDELVGGWQIAGDGNIRSQDFAVSGGNWGPTNPVHVYKHGIPVTDCRSGICFKEHEWFNGYIASTVTSGLSNSDCTTKCVTGLPSGWVPYETPIDTTPGTKYYGANEVSITLPGGKPADIAYSPGSDINPFTKTILNGPFNWTADASLFKVFPIKESMNLRLNVDAFNVLNYQGQSNLSGTELTDGTTPCTAPGGVGCSSANAPRQIQFTLRLTF